MGRIIVVRHGLVENPEGIYYGVSNDLPLSIHGVRQIQYLAKEFEIRGILPDQIVSSPLQRTAQTAEILGRTLNINENRADLRLLEVRSVGLEGRSFNELNSKFGTDWYAAVDGIDTWIEPFSEQAIRMRSAMEEYSETDLLTLMVSHGDPIMALLSSLHEPDLTSITFTELANKHGYPKKASAYILMADISGKWSVESSVTIKKIMRDVEDVRRFGYEGNTYRRNKER